MNTAIRRWARVALVMGLAAASTLHAATRTWVGAGANALASTPANWNDSTLPEAGDGIVFSDAHIGQPQTNATWDLDLAVASWTQVAPYAGTVTFLTRFPAGGALTNLAITGACTVSNGVWTHQANTGDTAEFDRLAVTVGGDFSLGPDASINLNGKGYAAARGPSAGGTATGSTGGGHGGLASFGTSLEPVGPTYGSVFYPESLGSGCYGRGGGALRLVVAGAAALDGAISARGEGGVRAGAAGGSILVQAAAVSGAGILDASGANGVGVSSGAGGGGRIAVILTAGSTFGGLSFRAFGAGAAKTAHHISGAGTVYLQEAGQAQGEGTLIVDNNNFTEFNPVYACTLLNEVNLNSLAALVITNRGILGINTNTALDFGAVPIRAAGASEVSTWRTATAEPARAAIALRGTNLVVFPDPFVISNYSLCLDVPIRAAGHWVVASNGSLSHSGNFAPTPGAETFRLNLELDGSLTVEPGGAIEANTKGYFGHKGPGAWSTTQGQSQTGAGHGGRGGQALVDRVPLSNYGSITAPTTLGSGGGRYLSSDWPPRHGAGAIQMVVHGTTTVHGVISVRQIRPTASRWTGAAGGSIYLRTGWLEGSGSLDARGDASGADNCGTGGGGRIAAILTDSESFGNVAMSAAGMPQGARSSGAGTLYREKASQSGRRGVVTLDNANNPLNTINVTNVATQLPPGNYATAHELRLATVVLTNRGQAVLTGNLTVGNLYIATNSTTMLYLKGFTLTVNTPFHEDWGHDNWVAYEGGQILWRVPGTTFLFR